MLSEREIVDKLYTYAGQFWEHMENKKYAAAKWHYKQVHWVVHFLEMETHVQREIFMGCVISEGILSRKKIESKLYKQAEQFKHFMMKKQYAKARWCYQQAYWTAYFVEVDEKTWGNLFGVRLEKGEYELVGEYPEEMMLKAGDMLLMRKRKKRIMV